MKMMFLWLLGLSIFDIRYRRVPVWLISAGAVVIVGVGIGGGIRGENNLMALLTGMIPGILLLLTAVITQKVGWADGMILMLTGSILGFRRCILAAMFSLIIISALSTVLLILKKAGKSTIIPYIPFLATGVLLCMLMGD